MKCQTEGCGQDALFAIQLMGVHGYRVGMCRAHAAIELAHVGKKETLDMFTLPECQIITDAHWWREHFYYEHITPELADRLQKGVVARAIAEKVEGAH